MKTKRLVLIAAVIATAVGIAFYLCRSTGEAPRVASVAKVDSRVAPTPTPALSAVASGNQAAQPFLEGLPTNQTASVRGTKPFVLRSEQKFQKSLRLAAESLGAKTIGVLSANELLVEADAASRARLARDGRFTSVDEQLPQTKIDPDLAKLIDAGAKELEVAIVTLTEGDRLRVIDRVRSLGGSILTGCINDGDSFRANLSVEAIARLAGQGDVRWMEPFVRPRFTNDLAVEPAAMSVRTVWDTHGLTGEGQFITTSDTGIDLDHEDLHDQVVDHKVATKECSDKDTNGHGTHTAGSIAGAGIASESYPNGPIRGTAWGAKLWAWFCDGGAKGVLTPDSKSELFQPDQENYPAYIHSASWGSDQMGKYESECKLTDEFVWKNPDFLPVYSAGNSGDNGTGRPVVQSIGSPAAAKNVLTVGATQNVRSGYFGGHDNYPLIPSGSPTQTASYSSRGPCQDGRTKPDIAAPGSGVLSTRSQGVEYGYGVLDEKYAYDCGTSMACPLTAGAVALVRQWLMEEKGLDGSDEDHPIPSSALMKAVITGGAKGPALPDNNQGWGRVDLEETLFPSSGHAVKLVDRIPFAEEEEFVWVIKTTDEAPFNVQLSWVDYPGNAKNQAVAKLVNDLDLTVKSLDGEGELHYGNGGDAPDRLNNLESVRFSSLPAGRYLVSVNCENVSFDSTDGGAAALYIRGVFDPDAPEEPYGRVRVRETGDLFLSLEKALAAAHDGETVEILEPLQLRKSFTITNSVTIVAVDPDPGKAVITPKNGATLTLADGANAFFTNVVFNHAGRMMVNAETGSVLRVAGYADLGEVRLATANNLKVAGKILYPIVVDAPFAKLHGEIFGGFEVDAPEVTARANYLLNKYDDEIGGMSQVVGGVDRLVWLRGASVPDEAAAARIEPVQAAYTNYRSLAVLLKYNRGGTAALLRDAVYTNGLELASPMTIYGAQDGLVVSPTDESFFDLVPGADLTLSNVTFSGRNGSAFIRIHGGSLALENGAALLGLNNLKDALTDGYPTSGAIALFSGSMTTRPGSVIRGCRHLSANPEIGGGGAIWIYGPDCTLNLEGGRITQCSVDTVGGAVLAVPAFGDAVPAVVNLGGPLTVFGNTAGPDEDVDDDLYLPGAKVNLTDNLTDGYVGLTYSSWPRPESEPFCQVKQDLQGSVTSYTLASFVCDDLWADEGEWYDAALSDDGENLVWIDGVYEARTTPDPDGMDTARIVRDDVTNYYYYVDGPSGAFADALEGDVIELLQDTDFVVDVPVLTRVTLKSIEGGDFTLARGGDCKFVVKAGGDLTIDGICVFGTEGEYGTMATDALLYVQGGALALTNGASVVGVEGSVNRGSGAIAVFDGGTFTMTDDAAIVLGRNDYVNEGDQTGVGAALLVDRGTAYLRGGMIFGNEAYRAAGVFVGNEGVVYVSGNLSVEGNSTLAGADSDFAVEDEGQLYLDGDLDDEASIGMEDGIGLTGSRTNLIGRISEAALEACGGVTGVKRYATSAARFYRDDNPMIRGVVVTNETEALLVWSTGVEDGVYVDDNGQYGVVSGTLIAKLQAIEGLFYDGNAKTGVVAVVGVDRIEGNVATNAGNYVAVAYLAPGYLWEDGSAGPLEVEWTISNSEPPTPPDPPEPPEWTVETNYPGPLAFKSIDRVSDTEWKLVITNRTPYCNYRLLWTTDLGNGFTSTGAWEKAAGDVDPIWTTNVLTSGGAWFWRAEGAEGTNMVPPAVTEP